MTGKEAFMHGCTACMWLGNSLRRRLSNLFEPYPRHQGSSPILRGICEYSPDLKSGRNAQGPQGVCCVGFNRILYSPARTLTLVIGLQPCTESHRPLTLRATVAGFLVGNLLQLL